MKLYHEEAVDRIELFARIRTGSCVINQGFADAAGTELHALKLSVGHYIH